MPSTAGLWLHQSFLRTGNFHEWLWVVRMNYRFLMTCKVLRNMKLHAEIENNSENTGRKSK